MKVQVIEWLDGMSYPVECSEDADLLAVYLFGAALEFVADRNEDYVARLDALGMPNAHTNPDAWWLWYWAR